MVAYHRTMSVVAYCDRCGHELRDGEMAVWTEARVPRRGHPARTYHEACYPDRRDERETQRGLFIASQPEGPHRLDETLRDWRMPTEADVTSGRRTFVVGVVGVVVVVLIVVALIWLSITLGYWKTS